MAIIDGKIPNVKVVLVICNNSDSGALSIAREHGIPAIHLSQKQFNTVDEFNQALMKTLNNYEANFIVLAGYMKKIDPIVIKSFRNRIVNIHPALLPAFGGTGMFGTHVHEAVIKCKAKQSGATVHIVDEEYDHGPIVLQKAVDVAPDETPATLAEKVLAIEHELYPEAIRLFAEQRVVVKGQQVSIIN